MPRARAIGGTTLTYAETCAAAAGYASALARAGTKAGDRVAIICGNRPALILDHLGCAWVGAVAVPINTASRGAQLEHILGNCGARIAVVDAELPAALAAVDPARISLERLWIVGEPDLADFVGL